MAGEETSIAVGNAWLGESVWPRDMHGCEGACMLGREVCMVRERPCMAGAWLPE